MTDIELTKLLETLYFDHDLLRALCRVQRALKLVLDVAGKLGEETLAGYVDDVWRQSGSRRPGA